MKKRLLGLLTAAAMLLSAMPVFAGGEIPSGDDLIWFNDGTNASEFEGGIDKMSVDAGAIKMTLTDNNEEVGKRTQIWQAAKTGLKTAVNSDTTAVLSFKIKAGQTDKHFWLTIADESPEGSQITTMAMTSAGKLSASSDGKWVGDKAILNSQIYAKNYTANTWYDITMVFKADHKTDYYVDGTRWFTATVPETFNINSQNMGFRPGIKFSDDFSTPGTANFWIDDIMWLTGSDNGFYAFADSDTYTVENPTIGLKFTEQVSNTDLASSVKVYNVQKGTQISASAAFDGNRDLKININEKLAAAEEYRIAMPALTSVTGKTIYNDNVYFMSENVGETVVNADETFDSFTQQTLDYYNTVSGNSYYYPNGWYLGFRWADQTKALIEPVEESSRGKVMRFGKSASGEQATSSIYYPMPEKINKGVTHISFDIKPEAYKVADSSNFAGLNTLFTLYPDALTAEQRDYTDGNGNNTCQINKMTSQIPLVGIVGNRLAFTTKNIFNVAGGDRWGALSSWVDNQDKSITDPDNNTWYTVKVDIDWSAKKISYNLNNQVTYESTTLLDELGLANGFGGIGFYSDYNAVNPCSLIDNLKIETVMPASGKSTTTIFSDDFSNYTAGTSKTNGEFYIPNDWATSHIWETQPSVTLKPNTMTQYDGTEGTAVKIAKSGPFGATNDGGSVSLYRGFGQKINEGIVTVEYDINAASALGSSDMDGKALHQFVFDVYPNALTAEQTAFDNATNKVGNSSLIKYINGIQGGAMFVAKDTGTLTDGSLYINADYRDWGFSKNSWHHIKTTFDFEAGTIQTNIDSADKGSAYQLSTFGLSDGISGIGFNQAWNAQNTDIYLDNVTAKLTVDKGGAKVSNIRFVDGKGQKAGVSDSVSTLTEKIEIAFSSAVDESSLAGGITLSDKSGKVISLTNGGFNTDTNTYTAILGDLMKKDTEYTLTTSGITSGGKATDDYSVSFKTAATGAFDVSQLYINGTIAAGNTITIGIKVLNTTGENKNVTFSYATYSGNQMIGCELEEKGVGGENKAVYTKEYTLTLDAETAAKLTDIRAFVWGDLTSVVPLTDFASLTK
ncbi:MAG: hypothetical protein SPH44_02530 [Eubacteriales bacterium]|nr:hypothetical protein [Eubacteriales bacterium]